MNALASIRQLWSGVAPIQPEALTGAAGKSASIPASELRALQGTQGASTTAGAQASDSSFSGLLGQMVRDVNGKQQVAAQAMKDLQSGQNVSLHQAMISMEEASVSFQLMVEVRNRLLESYQELMRMQA